MTTPKRKRGKVLKSSLIIAVDFDGTCVDHRYPEIGPEVPLCVETLRELSKAGHRLILWTMRSDEPLNEAIGWFANKGIPLYGVNSNPDQHKWTKSPKAYAQIYIDDAAFGCPRLDLAAFHRPCVDWQQVRDGLLFDADPIPAPAVKVRKV